MKKIISFFMLLLLTLGLTGCTQVELPSNTEENIPSDSTDEAESTPESNDKTEESESKSEGELVPTEEQVGFRIHYQRPDKNYKDWGVYLWADGMPSIEGNVWAFQEVDDYGGVLTIKFDEWGPEARAGKIGFIVRQMTMWDKDVAMDRFIDTETADLDEYGYYNIFLKKGDEEVYANERGIPADRIKRFLINVENNNFLVKLESNNEWSDFKITHGNDTLIHFGDSSNAGISELTNNKLVFNMGNTFPDIRKPFKAEVTFKESGKVLSMPINMAELYKTKEFNDRYTYNGELGAIYTKAKTTFKVWSPVSQSVTLNIYDTGSPLTIKDLFGEETIPGGNNTPILSKPMTMSERGVWEIELSGDYEGKYYTYTVVNGKYPEGREVVDPYAKSAGINGLRGMVVDFSKTNPEGWDQVKLNGKTEQQLIVYETHIADLTSAESWNGKEENRKLFTGFYEAGTNLTYTDSKTNEERTITTGFDHIVELGVNTVQILPFFDQANDERPDKIEFNWGYNPLNYNVLEGGYSSNPYDGYQRIIEFKELVKAYSAHGINILMDVVFNHTAGLEKTNFDVLMPHYYYRYRDGVALDGAACGSETASEMPMFRKFMIDSTEFWASEYKLGGFRFDLMGLHDIETMNLLSSNLKTKVDPSITVYGEPWHAGNVGLPNDQVAVQSNMAYYQGFGAFNDRGRDALMKGGMSPVTARGWVSNSRVMLRDDVATIKNMIKGKVLDGVNEVNKTVNYVTCHDNYTLYDRIFMAGFRNDEEIEKMAMLAQSLVLTSQGINFMLAGEEFLRTKGQDHNSYKSGYFTNQLNWDLKADHMDMFNNYKKLIALHNETNIFSKSSLQAQFIKVAVSNEYNLISYDIVDTLHNQTYRIVHANGYNGDLPRVVDLEGYEIYLDTLNSNLVASKATQISDFQTVIARKTL